MIVLVSRRGPARDARGRVRRRRERVPRRRPRAFGGRLVVLNLTPRRRDGARGGSVRVRGRGVRARRGSRGRRRGGGRCALRRRRGRAARARVASRAAGRADRFGRRRLEDDGSDPATLSERHHSSDDAPNVPRLFDGLDPSSRSFAFGRWRTRLGGRVGDDVRRDRRARGPGRDDSLAAALRSRRRRRRCARVGGEGRPRAPARPRSGGAQRRVEARDVAEAERAASTGRASREALRNWRTRRPARGRGRAPTRVRWKNARSSARDEPGSTRRLSPRR